MATFRDLKTNQPIEPQDFVPPTGLGAFNPFQTFTSKSHAEWAVKFNIVPAVLIAFQLFDAMLRVFSRRDQILAADFTVPWLIGVLLIMVATVGGLAWAACRRQQLWAGVSLFVWASIAAVQNFPDVFAIMEVGFGILGVRALMAAHSKRWLKLERAPLPSA